MSLEEIRQKKLKELQDKMLQQEDSQEQVLQQQIDQIESMAKQYLSRDALIRYSNLKLAHRDKAFHAATLIAQAVSTGQLNKKLTDREFKEILIALDQGKKQFRIKK